MKHRLGFVSNSSSSSFIVIDFNGVKGIPPLYGDSIKIPDTFGGHLEFGWEFHKWDTFADRLNFAALQASYKEAKSRTGKKKYIDAYYDRLKPQPYWREMLEEVLKEAFGIEDVDVNIWADENDANGHFAYIDHQSNCGDGENTEMFESKEALQAWLFGENSYVMTGNDNEEAPPGFYDEN